MKLDGKTLRKWIAEAPVDRLTAPQRAIIAEMEADRKARLASTKAIPATEMLDELRVLLEEMCGEEGCPPQLQNIADRVLRILGHPKDGEDFAETFGKATPTKARALITRHADAAERREQRPQIDRPRAGPEELAEARASRAFRKQLEELVSRKGDTVAPVKLNRLIRPLQNLKSALLRLEGHVAPYPEAAAAVQDALRAIDEFTRAPQEEIARKGRRRHR